MSKNFIVDTNVLLLEDPNLFENLINGEENNIFIPMAVLYELDKLKSEKPRLVKKAIEQLEKFKDYIKFIDTQLNLDAHVDTDILESISGSLHIEDPILITNDRLMRFISESAYEIPAQPYIRSAPEKLMAEVQSNRFKYVEGKLFYNEDLVKINECWGVTPRSEDQKKLMYSLLNEEINIISVNSAAGMGKSYVALACALYLTFEKKKYRRIRVVRPLVSTGPDIGFLPGDLREKIINYFYPITSIISDLTETRKVSKLYLDNGELNPRKIELLPTNYLRGANFYNDFVIVDEAQNFSRSEIRTLLTRLGTGCKIILLGDINQIDNPHLTPENNSISWVVAKLLDYSSYIHHILEGKNMRGEICSMVLDSGL